MKYRRALPLLCLLAVAPGFAVAQSPDPAAERARLANERIQAEAERRAREELELSSRAQQPAPVAEAPRGPEARPPAQGAPAAGQAPPSSAVTPAGQGRPGADADRTARGLQQLQELGRLKDAGHLTEAEFQRIKQRILDSHF